MDYTKILSTYDFYLEHWADTTPYESVERSFMSGTEITYCNKAVKDGYMEKGHTEQGRVSFKMTRKGLKKHQK